MFFFRLQQPILKKKQLSLDESQLNALKCIKLKLNNQQKIPLCGIYTCIDQAMAIWGLVSAIIFIGAQFLPISWIDQAIIWSILTVVGITITLVLTHAWTLLEQVSWLLYLWMSLMLLGLVTTDLAIAYGWSFILANLCNLWLLLSLIGYCLTGLGIRSRAFLLSAIIHGVTVFILPFFAGWQFLITGLVMASNLLIFAEGQWDMLLPREVLQIQNSPMAIRNYLNLRTTQVYVDY